MKLILVLLFLPSLIFARQKQEKLSLNQVLESTMAHYPLILSASKNVEAAKMNIKASLGQFDLSLKSKLDKRFSGFYDGQAADVILEKPLQYLNSSIYTGYKRSDGKFPSYEEKAKTLANGEFRAGLMLSLWKNRSIDFRRFNLEMKNLKLSASEIKKTATFFKVRQKAIATYWKWVCIKQIYLVELELLEVANKRSVGLRRRVQRGDLAKIYLTENKQYILKRKARVLKSKQKLFEAGLELSLFIRSKTGVPLVPSENILSDKMIVKKKILKKQVAEDKKNMVSQNPEIALMANEVDAEKLNVLMGENSLNPKIDLKYEVSRDRGVGSSTLKGTENRAMLSIEIPLERNLGKGKKKAALLKKKILNYEKKLLIERLSTVIEIFSSRVNNAVDIVKNSASEVGLALVLQKAELQKFFSGSSDFFIVNLREQNTADAKIKNLKAELDYQISKAAYEALTFSNIK